MNKGALEIDLYEVLNIIKKHIILIVSACILCDVPNGLWFQLEWQRDRAQQPLGNAEGCF